MTEANGVSTKPLISICIPTYNRPDMLREALDTCFEQTYPEFEIVIGDDSKNDLSEKLIAEYNERFPGKINYRHNKPSLGQNANVDSILKSARGQRLVLLHDDDWLLPDALEKLCSCWDQNPNIDAAFGKQYITDNEGVVQPADSKALNKSYHRVASANGLQPVSAVPGIQRMFPNDGYMVDTALAQKIGYRPFAEVGDACDADFGIRLCLAARGVWFLDEYTMKYRVTTQSVGKAGMMALYTYDVLKQITVPAAAEPARQNALRELAPSAASGFAKLGRTGKAMSIFLSSDYQLKHKASPRGLYHLYLIARSALQPRRS